MVGIRALTKEANARRNATLMGRGVSEHPCCCFGRVEPVIDLVILDRHVITRCGDMLYHLGELAACALDDLSHTTALLGRCTATVLGGLRP